MRSENPIAQSGEMNSGIGANGWSGVQLVEGGSYGPMVYGGLEVGV